MPSRVTRSAVLKPLVARVWSTAGEASGPRWERVLPSGCAHVVVRLGGELEILRDGGFERVGHAIVGGPRARFYWKELRGAGASVGAQLRPGAAGLVLGAPADELAGQHWALEDLASCGVAELRERILAASAHDLRMDLLEEWLRGRVPRLRGLHPAVAHALERFRVTSDVGQTARETGYSQRYFGARFLEAVGLGPKAFCRVRRFRRAAERLASGGSGLADVAANAGYADQAHFTREFRKFAGVTPGAYQRQHPAHALHLPAGMSSGVPIRSRHGVAVLRG